MVSDLLRFSVYCTTTLSGGLWVENEDWEEFNTKEQRRQVAEELTSAEGRRGRIVGEKSVSYRKETPKAECGCKGKQRKQNEWQRLLKDEIRVQWRRSGGTKKKS